MSLKDFFRKFRIFRELSRIKYIYRENRIYKKTLKINNKYKISDKIEKFHNIHQERRCFIIGNGPSLRLTDLEKLNNEFTFASNRINLLFDKTNWRPTYYLCQDKNYIINNYEEICNIKSEKFLSLSPFISNNLKFIEANYYLLNYSGNNNKFAYDFTKNVGNSATVTYSAIQLAVYMGFKEIILIGCDHQFKYIRDKKSKKIIMNNIENDHFTKEYSKGNIEKFEKKHNTNCFVANIYSMEKGFEIARDYCHHHNIKILNATRGGALEIFERINFDSIFEV